MIDDFGTVTLTLANGNNNPRLRVGFHEQSSAVSVHDERGKPRASLLVMGGLPALASTPSVSFDVISEAYTIRLPQRPLTATVQAQSAAEAGNVERLV